MTYMLSIPEVVGPKALVPASLISGTETLNPSSISPPSPEFPFGTDSPSFAHPQNARSARKGKVCLRIFFIVRRPILI